MINASILVVEDEGITAVDLQSRLERLGYRVVAIASSGARAIEAATKLRPDIVLMDIRLKGPMDGIDAAQHIGSKLNIPVTFLTAFADDAILARAQVTAPYGYLVKPFDERELHATLQMALYRRRIEQQIKEATEMLTAVNESLLELSPLEERELRRRFAIGVRASAAVTPVKRLLSVSSTSSPASPTERLAVRAVSRLRSLSMDNKSKGRPHHKERCV